MKTLSLSFVFISQQESPLYHIGMKGNEKIFFEWHRQWRLYPSLPLSMRLLTTIPMRIGMTGYVIM